MGLYHYHWNTYISGITKEETQLIYKISLIYQVFLFVSLLWCLPHPPHLPSPHTRTPFICSAAKEILIHYSYSSIIGFHIKVSYFSFKHVTKTEGVSWGRVNVCQPD